jgi:hypothetical protein
MRHPRFGQAKRNSGITTCGRGQNPDDEPRLDGKPESDELGWLEWMGCYWIFNPSNEEF